MKSLVSILLVLVMFNLSAKTNQWEGKPFALFELSDQHGKIQKNSDFSGKWAIFYFYPKDKTPGCTVEAQNFVDNYSTFTSKNVEIVGVSYDDVDSHKDFADTYEMKFTLLADTDRKLSKAMDVDRILPWPHSSRQTFIVNPQGHIVKHYEDVTPKTHSQELLIDLEQLQMKK